jgi:hypothetical protein
VFLGALFALGSRIIKSTIGKGPGWDHRFIKKKVRASQCFKSFHTAEQTLEGIEAVNMMRKGQVKRLVVIDAQGQAKFVASLFNIAA